MDIPAYLVYILPIEESQVELHYPLSHIFHRQGRFSECPASASGAAEAGSRDTISSLSAGPTAANPEVVGASWQGLWVEAPEGSVCEKAVATRGYRGGFGVLG